jgi:hypothetical protein
MQKSCPRPHVLSASRRFRYTPEHEGAVRRGETAGNPRLRKLLLFFNAHMTPGHPESTYESLVRAFKDERLAPSAADVGMLSMALPGMRAAPGYVGVFFSAMVNCGDEDRYKIHAFISDIRPRFLGYKCGKEVVVDGDAGDNAGEQMSGRLLVRGSSGRAAGMLMRGGVLEIEGCAGPQAGLMMHDGELLIRGDAGDGLGDGMSGGKITVLGTAGADVGRGMSGGEIHVVGGIGGVGDAVGGRIFHDGRLVFDKQA